MFPPNYFVFMPMTRADDAFPSIFFDKGYLYKNPATLETKIAALKDLERTFQLLNTGVYEVPENYAPGLKKIVEYVGDQLHSDGGNATSLRKQLEREAYPDRKGCVGGFLQGMRSVFGRKTKPQITTLDAKDANEEGRKIGGQPDPHAYAKLRMRFPDAGP
jgi:hypothetical protein